MAAAAAAAGQGQGQGPGDPPVNSLTSQVVSAAPVEYTVEVPSAIFGVPEFTLTTRIQTFLHPSVEILYMNEASTEILRGIFLASIPSSEFSKYQSTVEFQPRITRFTVNIQDTGAVHDFMATMYSTVFVKGKRAGFLYMEKKIAAVAPLFIHAERNVPEGGIELTPPEPRSMYILHIELDPAIKNQNVRTLFRSFAENLGKQMESPEPPPAGFFTFANVVSAPSHLQARTLPPGSPLARFPANLLRNTARYLGSPKKTPKLALLRIAQNSQKKGGTRRRSPPRRYRSRASTRRNGATRRRRQ